MSLDPKSGGLSRRHYLGLSVASLAAPWLQACGGDAEEHPDWSRTEAVRWSREHIRAALERSGSTTTTAVSVALLADDRVVWREAFGYADRQKEVPATTETRFNIGSVSKVVTALAVMILCDRKKLELDQPLADLLPTFRMLSPGFTRVTVRHLLSHASGFPGNNMRDSSMFSPYLGYAQDTQSALEFAHLKHEPGELAVYCNDGFTMIEPLVQALDGRAFPDFVQQEIFDPLDMRSSGYPVKPLAEGTYVHPYFKDHSLTQEMATPFASGGITSTPSDMMKFAQMLIDQGVYQGRRLVSAQAIQDMGVNQGARTTINPAAASWQWGLGWDSVQQAGMNAAGVHAWSKNGGTFFFSSEFFVLPELRMAMLVTGSGHDYEPQKIAEGLLLRAALARGAISKLPDAISPAIPGVASSPVSADVARPGIYASSKAPLQVTIDREGSVTLSSWNGDGWVVTHDQLRQRSDGNWWADGWPRLCYRFQSVGPHHYLIRRELSASALNWGELPLGEWMPPLDTPLPAAWKARLGSQWRYANDAPQAVTRLLAPIVWRLRELKVLPGYLLLEDQLLRVVNDEEAGMVVKVPGDSGRDLYEIRMVKSAQEGMAVEELRLGSVVFERYIPDGPNEPEQPIASSH